jgi:hypothetical protein
MGVKPGRAPSGPEPRDAQPPPPGHCADIPENPRCRNIRPLFNFEPPATPDEIHASALQFVRKVSGFAKPSKSNEVVFNRAVEDVAAAARRLVFSLETTSPPKNREIEAAKARARSAERYA